MRPSNDRSRGAPPTAFLLAQVGAHAASRFAVRLAALALAPPHAGILRIIGLRPALTQQALAEALGTQPSRLVALVDDLETRGLIERQPNPADRRSHALHLTEKGRTMLETIGRIGREHQQALLAALNDEEQKQLAILLRRIADHQGLAPGVHPGFGRLPSAPESACAEKTVPAGTGSFRPVR